MYNHCNFHGHFDAGLFETQIKGKWTKFFGPFIGFWLFWCYPAPPLVLAGQSKIQKLLYASTGKANNNLISFLLFNRAVINTIMVLLFFFLFQKWAVPNKPMCLSSYYKHILKNEVLFSQF